MTPEQARMLAAAMDRNRRSKGQSAPLAAWAALAKGGKLQSVPMYSPLLTVLAKPMLKGNVTAVWGPPSVSKSYFVTQNLIEWHRMGVPFAAKFYEDNQEIYLARILAQLAGDARLKDPDWIERNGEAWDAAYRAHRDVLDAMAPSIEADSGRSYSYAEAIAWAEERVTQGCRIIVLDPVTALDKDGPGYEGMQPWDADKAFARHLQRIVAGRATALIVSHPGGDGKQMAGGKGFERFCHCILHLESNPKRTTYTVKDRDGLKLKTVPNRLIGIQKAREGSGTGLRIASHFALRYRPEDSDEPVRLTFQDAGIVVGTAKAAEPAKPETPKAAPTQPEERKDEGGQLWH